MATKRNYKLEYKNYQSSEEQKKNRAARNKARRIMMEKGIVKKGDGKDVDHRIPLSEGGSKAVTNLRVQTAHANRSFRRDRDGSIKG
jgi:5-methylcytosine-specific restriction endonuclease McrA